MKNWEKFAICTPISFVSMTVAVSFGRTYGLDVFEIVVLFVVLFVEFELVTLSASIRRKCSTKDP